MKLPKSVIVGPFVYKVKALSQKQKDDHDVNGMCVDSRLTILVNKKLPPQALIETLWHEINHAISNVANLTDQSSEEDFVRRGSPLQLAVLRDNPDLLELIQEHF